MKKRNIYLLYAISLLQGMIFYGPVATLYRQEAGVSVFQITLIESISVTLMILLEVPWGRVADRIGYRRTMIFCCGYQSDLRPAGRCQSVFGSGLRAVLSLTGLALYRAGWKA